MSEQDLIEAIKINRATYRAKLGRLRTEIRRLNKAVRFWKVLAENETLRGVIRERNARTPAAAQREEGAKRG